MSATVVTQRPNPSVSRGGSSDDLLQMIVDSLDGARTVYHGIEQFEFDDSAAVPLPNIPAKAMGAILLLEADAAIADVRKAARFTEGGLDPSAIFGFPLGDFGQYEIKSRIDLENFRIIGIDAGLSHKLMIKYTGVDGEQ